MPTDTFITLALVAFAIFLMFGLGSLRARARFELGMRRVALIAFFAMIALLFFQSFGGSVPS